MIIPRFQRFNLPKYLPRNAIYNLRTIHQVKIWEGAERRSVFSYPNSSKVSVPAKVNTAILEIDGSKDGATYIGLLMTLLLKTQTVVHCFLKLSVNSR